MAMKTYKPTSPARRQMTNVDYSCLSKDAPERSLLTTVKKKAGRNSYGRITVRHQGGGNKVKYRIIDFKRNKRDVPATVASIQYDPNRTAFICPEGLQVGDQVIASVHADIKPGNVLPLDSIPVGTVIHNVELYPGRGAQLVRSAGNSAQLMAKENGYAQIRLPSGEVRLVRLDCVATIGVVSNGEHSNVSIGKAGRKRHMGIRPTVRGSVMNPCDHPHGGGEGKSPIGRSGPVTPWGKPTLGYKTRSKKAKTDKFIVKRRNAK